MHSINRRYRLLGTHRATGVLFDSLPRCAVESTCLRCRQQFHSTKYMPYCLNSSCNLLARILDALEPPTDELPAQRD